MRSGADVDDRFRAVSGLGLTGPDPREPVDAGSDGRAELARIGRDAVQAGLVVGSGGNLSTRESGSDHVWVTAAGSWLDRLDEREFVQVGLDDDRVRRGTRGDGRRPSSEVALHLATYRVRPDVGAIVHVHPQLVILLDALGERIRLLSTDHQVYLGAIARTPFHPPGSVELADAAARAVADGANCVVLPHHGCSVLGETALMAYRRAANLEEAARLTYRALLLTGGLPGRSIEECPSLGSGAGLI